MKKTKTKGHKLISLVILFRLAWDKQHYEGHVA